LCFPNCIFMFIFIFNCFASHSLNEISLHLLSPETLISITMFNWYWDWNWNISDNPSLSQRRNLLPEMLRIVDVNKKWLMRSENPFSTRISNCNSAFPNISWNQSSNIMWFDSRSQIFPLVKQTLSEYLSKK
jgi:hypothetical protein